MTVSASSLFSCPASSSSNSVFSNLTTTPEEVIVHVDDESSSQNLDSISTSSGSRRYSSIHLSTTSTTSTTASTTSTGTTTPPSTFQRARSYLKRFTSLTVTTGSRSSSQDFGSSPVRKLSLDTPSTPSTPSTPLTTASPARDDSSRGSRSFSYLTSASSSSSSSSSQDFGQAPESLRRLSSVSAPAISALSSSSSSSSSSQDFGPARGSLKRVSSVSSPASPAVSSSSSSSSPDSNRLSTILSTVPAGFLSLSRGLPAEPSTPTPEEIRLKRALGTLSLSKPSVYSDNPFQLTTLRIIPVADAKATLTSKSFLYKSPPQLIEDTYELVKEVRKNFLDNLVNRISVTIHIPNELNEEIIRKQQKSKNTPIFLVKDLKTYAILHREWPSIVLRLFARLLEKAQAPIYKNKDELIGYMLNNSRRQSNAGECLTKKLMLKTIKETLANENISDDAQFSSIEAEIYCTLHSNRDNINQSEIVAIFLDAICYQDSILTPEDRIKATSLPITPKELEELPIDERIRLSSRIINLDGLHERNFVRQVISELVNNKFKSQGIPKGFSKTEISNYLTIDRSHQWNPFLVIARSMDLAVKHFSAINGFQTLLPLSRLETFLNQTDEPIEEAIKEKITSDLMRSSLYPEEVREFIVDHIIYEGENIDFFNATIHKTIHPLQMKYLHDFLESASEQLTRQINMESCRARGISYVGREKSLDSIARELTQNAQTETNQAAQTA